VCKALQQRIWEMEVWYYLNNCQCRNRDNPQQPYDCKAWCIYTFNQKGSDAEKELKKKACEYQITFVF
jgi:hypothetical protein